MRRLWSVTGLVCLIFAATARADTVYLKNGDTVWGSEVTEVNELVLVFRAGEKVELRNADVERIERARLSIPRYYAPDGGGGFTASGPPPGMPPGQPPGPPGMPMAPGPPGMGGPISGSPQTGLPAGGGTSSSGTMGSGSATIGSGPSPMGPGGGPSVTGGVPGGSGTGTSVTTGPAYGPAPPGQAGQIGMSPRDRDVPPPPR
jgi:hypothetical protein